jgi:hypothetical protein
VRWREEPAHTCVNDSLNRFDFRRLLRFFRAEVFKQLLVSERIKVGLPTSDNRRPTLVLGHRLAAFLQARRAKGKQPCQPEEIYCVRCRTPRFPQGGWAEYQPVTEKFGNLTAICPNCDSIMNRRISMANLGQVRSKLDIAFPQALRQVNESNEPTVNSDLK